MIKIGDEVLIKGNNRTDRKFINLTGKVMGFAKLGGWVNLYIPNQRTFIKIQKNALSLIVKDRVEFKISNRSAFKKYVNANKYIKTIPNSSFIDYPSNSIFKNSSTIFKLHIIS